MRIVSAGRWVIVLGYFGLGLLGTVNSVGAAEVGQATLGHARFTVVTPHLIRMEYSPADRFVDAPSWFAVDRTARFSGAEIRQDVGKLTIDTGAIRLVYTDNGQPFSPANMSAVIRRGDQTVTWQPGVSNTGNLGGTIRTLDQIKHAVDLGEGVISRDGWYLLDDSKSGLMTSDWIQSRPADGNQDWYLFGYGQDYRAALKSLTTIGGPIPMPRKYTLGLWYSRYWPFTADAFKQIVEEYEQHGFPLDTMVMDMGWHLNAVPASLKGKVDTWTGYTWDEKLIPDPVGLLKWMHDRGLHVTLNEHPAAGIQPHEAAYGDFMTAMGQDASTNTTIPFDAGDKHYLDTFYAHTHTPLENQGVDFWWLDWQQYPKTRSNGDWDNLRVLNWYNYNHSAANGQRGVSFSRWAGWGDHRYPIHFSGDADTGWPMLAAEVPFTSTAGNVGCFFWSHDIGGHMGGRNEESYARWCQFGAMSAALRSHSTMDKTTDRRPWNYPKWAEDSMRVSFRLRSLLMPYLYTAMQQATADSVPFTRPLYLDHPAIEAAYHNAQEYRFGDDLLVAPIATPGVGPGRVAAQAVWFPPNRDGSATDWFDYFTGEKFASGQSAVATAPVDQFPLYVRGGVPLPMQPYTPRPATATLQTLVVRCYPGRDGVTRLARLYEDDGKTIDYRNGMSATTKLSYVQTGDSVRVAVDATVGTFAGQPIERGLIIELPCTEPGATADIGTCTYDAATGITRIELPPAPINTARTVTVKVRETSPEKVTAAAIDARLRQLLGQSLAQWKAANPKPSEEIAQMIAAVQGVAVLPVNQHPYGFGNDVALIYFHNHHANAEKLTLTDPSPTQITITPGGPIVRAGKPAANVLPIRRRAELTGIPDSAVSLPLELSSPLSIEADLATSAVASASTGTAAAAIDGSIDGYPGNQAKEWVTRGEHANAWLKLEWPEPTRMTQVLLYDRPNDNDHVLAGKLTFSDGTTIDVGPLPNDGGLPGEIAFPAKTCSWVKFTATKVGERTQNIGLSEIAVINAR
ncbi:MAG: alpha-xylosidase [Phycisphaerales bacterium]|nr:alpha-xylosidase [Phycisphaerales bacterium]